MAAECSARVPTLRQNRAARKASHPVDGGWPAQRLGVRVHEILGMNTTEPSRRSEREDQVANLEAELVAIAFWDYAYLESGSDVNDEVAFHTRQLRAQQIIFELKVLKRILRHKGC
jgi:hypothetical protein